MSKAFYILQVLSFSNLQIQKAIFFCISKNSSSVS